MNILPTFLPEVLLLAPKVLADSRGFFLEIYNQRTFARLGIDVEFVQDNHSRSSYGVLRGLHYQIGQPQAKLVRCIRGEVFDVAVDIRRGSPTFGRWAAARLSEDNKQMMYLPEGFAHGFCVTSATAEVVYKCSDFYAQAEERGILWNDPQLAIDWPLAADQVQLSEKDRQLLPLSQMAERDLPTLGVASCES